MFPCMGSVADPCQGKILVGGGGQALARCPVARSPGSIYRRNSSDYRQRIYSGPCRSLPSVVGSLTSLIRSLHSVRERRNVTVPRVKEIAVSISRTNREPEYLPPTVPFISINFRFDLHARSFDPRRLSSGSRGIQATPRAFFSRVIRLDLPAEPVTPIFPANSFLPYLSPSPLSYTLAYRWTLLQKPWPIVPGGVCFTPRNRASVIYSYF